MILENKKILITGAGGGLGAVIAATAAREGAALALCEREGVAIAAVDSASSFTGDLRDPEAVARMVKQAVAKLGRLDGVVNCAAITAADDGGVIETTPAAWQETLDINLSGTFYVCQQCLPHLQEAGGGSIVNLSSVVAHRGSAVAQIAYTASKGGVEAMTRELAVAHARENIRANCVAAGPVQTPRNEHYFDTPEKWERRRRHIPAGRLGQPQEIAELVCFLLSDKSAYQTGSTIFADGGIHAAYLVDDK